MPFKRPRLTKREEAAAPGAASAPQPAKPARGISTQELQSALRGSYTAPGTPGGPPPSSITQGRPGTGITTKELGKVLGAPEAASGHGSVESTRVTSYPLDRDFTALPVKAGTRTGPRVTSYRIPIRKAAHSNVYDTIN